MGGIGGPAQFRRAANQDGVPMEGVVVEVSVQGEARSRCGGWRDEVSEKKLIMIKFHLLTRPLMFFSCRATGGGRLGGNKGRVLALVGRGSGGGLGPAYFMSDDSEVSIVIASVLYCCFLFV